MLNIVTRMDVEIAHRFERSRLVDRCWSLGTLRFGVLSLARPLRLVEHRYARGNTTSVVSPDLGSCRMRGTLERAVLEAHLWALADNLVLATTSLYPHCLLEEATMPVLRREIFCRYDIDKLSSLMCYRR